MAEWPGRQVLVTGATKRIGTRAHRAVAARGGAPRFGTLPDGPPETQRTADLGPTRRTLGWAPATALDDGLARTADGFRARAVPERA